MQGIRQVLNLIYFKYMLKSIIMQNDINYYAN